MAPQLSTYVAPISVVVLSFALAVAMKAPLVLC